MSSVHSKLMQARLRLQNTPLKKSGHNKFAGYQYFELGDFLPTVQTIFADLGLCGIVSYTADIAKLTITDCEQGGTSLEITSPMGSAALKGCHEVQNVGAVETYQRRCLWVTAMEIVEHDALDAVTGSSEPVKKVSPVRPNSAGEDFWNNAEGDEKEFLNLQLSIIRDHLEAESPGKASNSFYAMNDQEEQAAVWSQLGSKERAAIKQHKPQPVLEKAA